MIRGHEFLFWDVQKDKWTFQLERVGRRVFLWVVTPNGEWDASNPNVRQTLSEAL